MYEKLMDVYMGAARPLKRPVAGGDTDSSSTIKLTLLSLMSLEA